ncbi:2,3-diaminopropionate biosynthesis protein SbnA [Planobispora longispora]|uniref:2,3-diaminopropionate biosynthesis protein SbnA n=2 Tax=Planobispora longispora TaxID=28887 RepID=A0A8J3RP26_9ACTN|nr:2,3-diaminopropionate biosynthesis protein SbnA [Planobispora longispora]
MSRMTTAQEVLRSAIPGTPVVAAEISVRGRTHEVLLKLESGNPTGSIKDRTAAGLLMALDAERPLRPGTVVVESTSGNLGLGLARLLHHLDCRFVAVIDPNTPRATRQTLVAAGGELHEVTEPDGRGGYLLTRLREVRRILGRNPGYRWTDQYHNPANPRIHRDTTGPEIAAHGGRDLDAVYIAVSTGGTLAGVAGHLHALDRGIAVVAVDAVGSLATGDSTGPRLISGIGASRPSAFLTSGSYDRAHRVPDAEAVAACRLFRADTGVALGGSSGSVVAACLRDLASPRPPRRPLCLCADSGLAYADTLYDHRWIASHALSAPVAEAESRLRADGIRFRLKCAYP